MLMYMILKETCIIMEIVNIPVNGQQMGLQILALVVIIMTLSAKDIVIQHGHG